MSLCLGAFFAETLRFTWHWVRQYCVQPFPNTGTYCHTCIQVLSYQPLQQLHSDLGDFSNGVCQVSKITVTETNESNPDTGLETQQKMCFGPSDLV